MNKVLALTKDGKLTYCVSAPEKRGMGRCNHVEHQGENEDASSFISRITDKITLSGCSEEEIRSTEEIIRDVIRDQKTFEYNRNADWNEELSGMIPKFFFIESERASGSIDTEITENEYGDKVQRLTMNVDFRGEHYSCDFGDVPYIDQETGIFTINGTEYRCLPVMSKNKIGYGQFEDKDGHKKIFLYQNDNNNGNNISAMIDATDGVAYCFGKKYSLDDLKKALETDEELSDNKLKMVRAYTNMEDIKKRIPEFGEPGGIDKMIAEFSPDRMGDLTDRKIYTYNDFVKKDLEMQMRRMGVTFYNHMTGKRNIPYPLVQNNNTDNIKSNLTTRSNVQLVEDINPIAAMAQVSKISLTGQEGYNKDTVPAGVRSITDSYFGMTDSLDVSSGKSIGLTVPLKECDVIGGRLVKTPGKHTLTTSDFVPFRNHNAPGRVSMACSQLRQAIPLTYGEDPKPLGDPRSDAAWDKIKGAKLGVNCNIVNLPSEKTWEDSCYVSESMAKRLSFEKDVRVMADPRYKVGDYVKAGTIIGGHKIKYDGVLQEGKNGDFKMHVKVPFGVGDKITNRYGGKNTCSRILPDSEMPKVRNSNGGYVPADLVTSNTSTVKRGNLGSKIEQQHSYGISEKDAFKSENTQSVILSDGKTVPADCGGQYIMRLNQLAEEKSYANDDMTVNSLDEAKGRVSEMSGILLSTTPGRRKVLGYLKHQGTDDVGRDLDHLLKSIGVERK